MIEILIKEMLAAINSGEDDVLSRIIDNIMAYNQEPISKIDKIQIIISAMEHALNINNANAVNLIYYTIKMQEESEVKNILFSAFNANENILYLINRVLFDFLGKISPPYNGAFFDSLDIEIEDEFLDPITSNVINFPVTLHGCTYDFDTIELIDAKSDGYRVNPYSRKKFTLEDVKPDYALHDKFKVLISCARSKRQKAINFICRTAAKGNIEELENLFLVNDKIKINDVCNNGYSALHYACKNKQLECAKYLIIKGADLDLISECDGESPFSLLQWKSASMADNLKKYTLSYLQSRMVVYKDKHAYLRYAKLHLNGVVVEKDVPRAIANLENAGSAGEISGYLLCADIYSKNIYASNDIDLVLSYYQRAVSEAQSLEEAITVKIKLAIFLFDIHGRVDFNAIGLKLSELVQAVNTFNKDAQFMYSLLFKGQEGVDNGVVTYSRKKFIKYMKYAADNNHAKACLEYGTSNYIGDILPQNHAIAAYYFKRAAELGLPDGQYNYAICCDFGHGIEKNSTEAAKYYKMAADRGHAAAMYVYSICCIRGNGVKIDSCEAIKYLQQAVDNQWPEAQHVYACNLAVGDGVEKNTEEAIKLLKKSADNGYLKAQFEYAVCLKDGKDTEVNIAEAVRYFKMALEGGYLDARSNYDDCLILLNEQEKLQSMIKLSLLSPAHSMPQATETLRTVNEYNNEPNPFLPSFDNACKFAGKAILFAGVAGATLFAARKIALRFKS